ncbi:MAG: PadR family transcriptional regulator [Acidobacteriota bacterium]
MSAPSMNLLRGTLDLLVLRTLSHGALHGYAVSRFIRESSRDALQIEEGALYPALRRLEKKGLLESWWDATDTGRDAKFYELTDTGRAHLERELAQWERYVEAMRRVLFEAEPPLALGAP